MLDAPAEVIIQDRVMDSQPGKPKPVCVVSVYIRPEYRNPSHEGLPMPPVRDTQAGR